MTEERARELVQMYGMDGRQIITKRYEIFTGDDE